MGESGDSMRHYLVLGVRADASPEEIDNAYTNLKSRLSTARYAGSPLSELAKQRLDEVEVAYTELKKHQENRHHVQKCGYRPGYYRRYNSGCCPDCGDLCTACACIWTADTCCECAGGDCI